MRKNTDCFFLISRLKSSMSSVYDVNAKRNPVFYEFLPITANEDTNIKHFSLLLSYSSVFVIAAILASHIWFSVSIPTAATKLLSSKLLNIFISDF